MEMLLHLTLLSWSSCPRLTVSLVFCALASVSSPALSQFRPQQPLGFARDPTLFLPDPKLSGTFSNRSDTQETAFLSQRSSPPSSPSPRGPGCPPRGGLGVGQRVPVQPRGRRASQVQPAPVTLSLSNRVSKILCSFRDSGLLGCAEGPPAPLLRPLAAPDAGTAAASALPSAIAQEPAPRSAVAAADRQPSTARALCAAHAPGAGSAGTAPLCQAQGSNKAGEAKRRRSKALSVRGGDQCGLNCGQV